MNASAAGGALAANMRAETRTIGKVDLEVLVGGTGPRLVLLHDMEYLNEWQPFQEALAHQFEVIAPSHPGFGKSTLPAEYDRIDDLAYACLDFLRSLGPEPVHLVGLGFGGWIAAEVAVRCTHHLSRLVLVDALGIKVSDPTTRDIFDTFIVSASELVATTWHDAALGTERMKVPGLGSLSEEEIVTLVRNRQTAALVGWNPFLHTPKLLGRLARVDVPTLVLWGEDDRMVTPEYGRAYAAAIPGARFATIPAAGHYPYLEQPDAFVAALAAFLHEGERAAASPTPTR